MTEIFIPQENANDESVKVTKVFFKNNQFIEKGQVILEYETSKAEIEFESPVTGWLFNFNIKVDDFLEVGKVFAIVTDKKNEKNYTENQNGEASNSSNKNFLSNKASKLLEKDKKILSKNLWITSKDFIPHNSDINKISSKNSFLEIEDKIKISFTKKKLNFRKKKEIEALSNRSNYFNSTHGIEIIGDRSYNENFIQGSILDLVSYETAKLLKGEYADLNSFYYDENHIGLYDSVVPGIALDNYGNLVVVSLKKFDSLMSTSNEILRLADSFFQEKLLANDFSDTTFTITDLSNSATNFVLPLLNGFQCFILAICKTKSGFDIYGSFDHRVTEGKRFSNFLKELKLRIESFLNDIEKTGAINNFKCFYCDLSLEQEKKKGQRGLRKVFDGQSDRLICINCIEGW